MGVEPVNKDTLRNFRWLRLNMKMLQNRVIEIETAITKQTSVISDMPRGSAEMDKMAEGVARLLEAKEKLLAKQLEATQAIVEIEHAIDQGNLTEREKYLIRRYYIDCLSWGKVCKDMTYSDRQIQYIHKTALEKIADNCSISRVIL
jgi:DNA-directed RNA polymerase specialized sigma subunit